MIITQDDLIKTIAQREDIAVSTVRAVFNAAENTIFGHLSSTTPTQPVTIKLLNGLRINGIYVPSKMVDKGMYHNEKSNPQVRAKAYITQHYNRKLNGQISTS